MPASASMERSDISGHAGAAEIRSPLIAWRSPRLTSRVERTAMNQYEYCDRAHSSFIPFQAGNARVPAKAGPAIKSSFPSRISSGPSLVLYTNSISIPSCLKKPSSTAAIATKYEGESRSGTHIRYMRQSHSRRRAGLLRLDIRCSDHLAPLLGFVGNELPEFDAGHRFRLNAYGN